MQGWQATEVLGATAAGALAIAALFRFMIWLRSFAQESCGVVLVCIGMVAMLVLLFISCQPRPGRWKDMAVPSTRLPAAILAGVMALHVGSVLLDPTYAEFHPDIAKLSGMISFGKARDARDLECADGLQGQHADYDYCSGLQHSCACVIPDKTMPFVPEHATCGIEGAALPPCYMDSPVDQTTFAVQYENPAECFHGNGLSEADARKCFTRTSKNKSAIFLVGDSHARALKNGIATAMPNEILPANWYGTCGVDHVNEIWPALEAEVRAGDMVWYVVKMHSDECLDGYRTVVAKLHELTTKKEAKLVLVCDWPKLKDPGPGGAGRQEAFFCYSGHVLGNHTPCSQSLADMDQQREGMIGILKNMQMKTGVYVFNASKFVCPEGLCDYNIPNRRASAYFDYGHLNPFGSRYLAPFLCDFAMSHGLK
mmetsp:Transcript_5321/g.13246  ORF Transcript_5321/g.13246 Transcript_5321/m.13246 type:complete len:426 (+) Transcript_5321:747-2024(+)